MLRSLGEAFSWSIWRHQHPQGLSTRPGDVKGDECSCGVLNGWIPRGSIPCDDLAVDFANARLKEWQNLGHALTKCSIGLSVDE